MNPERKNKASLVAWLLYDFANSSYSAVIGAVVFPVYVVQHIASTPETGDLWWGRAVSLSMLAVALSAPFTGGIADLSGYRKRFLILYTVSAAVFILVLVPATGAGLFFTLLVFGFANFFVEGAFVFYNAFLPYITTQERVGRVSGWGFGLGYLGSAVSLLIALMLVKVNNYWGVWTFVAVFFMLFSIPSFLFLNEPEGQWSLSEAALKGWQKTFQSLFRALTNRDLRLFLISYFFFRDGINTIIVFSSIFAANTLGFEAIKLVWLYLLIQVMAMAGSLVFSWPADIWGPKKVLLLSLSVWTVLCLWALEVDTGGFWFMASLGGMFLGATQAAARAMFSRFIPEGLEAEYFGMFGFIGKTSAILGPVLFGTMVAMTGSERYAALAVGGLFVLGLAFLFPVKLPDVHSEKKS